MKINNKMKAIVKKDRNEGYPLKSHILTREATLTEDNHDEIFPRINLLIFQDHLKYKRKPHKEELQAPQLKKKLECDPLTIMRLLKK